MSEDARYLESLQKSLLTDGWGELFDHSRLRAWVNENRQGLSAQARRTTGVSSSDLEEHFARVVDEFEPKTKFDLPTTDAIFRSLFSEIEQSAASIGLQPIRRVELVTSTSIGPSPFARPTTGIHQLFIGPGTSAFCNYWAKAYTAIVQAIAHVGPMNEPITFTEDLLQRTRNRPEGMVAAARLALHFAVFGTVLGFGEYKQPSGWLAYRMQLLQAMEVFALSHEYAHFVVDERQLKFAADDHQRSDHGLEFFCDELGLQISREWANRNDNWLAFSGVGALAFFHAVETCLVCTETLASSVSGDSPHAQLRTDPNESSHPDSKSRIANVASLTVNNTAEDQKDGVARFVEEFSLICDSVCEFVADVVGKAVGPSK